MVEKRGLTVCLVLLCFWSLALNMPVSKAACSSDGGDAIIMSVDSNQITTDLMVSSNGDASFVVTARGKQKTSKVDMTVTLQHLDKSSNTWMEVNHWMVSENYSTASLRKTYHVMKTGSYRLKVKATMTRSGRTETVTEISNMAKY